MLVFLDGPDAYMAFGRSGSDTATEMNGADVFVAYYRNDEVKVVDHHFTAESQVAFFFHPNRFYPLLQRCLDECRCDIDLFAVF